MNVSKEAREAAATMLDDYRDRLTPVEQSDSAIVAINVRNGVCDDTIRVQAFAKFEAEITQRVRDQALEEAARVADEHWNNSQHAAHKVTVRNIAAAIRQMIGGGA
ncbi:hypothetical protein [Sphingobium baderi]|uniref:Uncharacterized protein n=1 Tax=Sphingobium baderi LL03 TaxID=1114964 RepID=T0G8C6_9SPHN|nr:hypothetical protein [Sphingobium baderi]EQA96876.1 hypothetical protein L485_22615 [Sphingobium baderi LL03]KMS64117.1 hypothetical protein V475_20185 [Sphingobium baderi LL03]